MSKKYYFHADPSLLTPSNRLDHVIFQWFQTQPEKLSRSFIRKLIQVGAVYKDKQRVHIASKPISPGVKIELYINKAPVQEKPSNEPQIIFEDEWIVVVNKPSLMPSVATIDRSRANLTSWLKDTLKTPIGVHHRLDKDTSGIILFSKSPAANKGIADLFQNRTIKKTYTALCQTQSPCLDPFTITNYLKNLAPRNQPQKFGSTHSGGDFAQTHFTPQKSTSQFVLFQAHPITGRTHQIRVHLSEAGYPILGDSRYHGCLKLAKEPIPRTLLHATTLEFLHPVSKNPLCLSAEFPEDFKKACDQIFADSSL
jgi:RluA family pseudouridine synthase